LRSEQLDGFKLMPKGLEKELCEFRELDATNKYRDESALI
jgi:hypothetical protein